MDASNRRVACTSASAVKSKCAINCVLAPMTSVNAWRDNTIHAARRFRSIRRRIIGVKISCIAKPILPPGHTMFLGRRIQEPCSDREARQVSLTLTGEYLLTYARRVLAELKDAQDMATLR